MLKERASVKFIDTNQKPLKRSKTERHRQIITTKVDQPILARQSTTKLGYS